MERYDGETVGERIRRLRTGLGLSQRAIVAPGVSAGYISRIEHGMRTPSVKALRALALRLGVSAEYLETGSDVADKERRDWLLAEAELELRLGDDPGSAEAKLKELLDDSLRAGDRAGSLRALAGLGFAAAHRGAHREAIDLLERVVLDPSIAPHTHPDVFATLAQSYATVGPEQKAVELFEQCLTEVAERAPESSAAYVRFATYLSYALSDLGDLTRARAVLEDALAHVDEATDPYSRIRLYWSQARLAEIEGDHAQAQASIRRAIALLEVTEDTLHLARAHLLYAESTLAEDRPDTTSSLLETAERLFGARCETKDRVWLLVLRAELDLSIGESERAAETARDAIALSGEDDPELVGRAETMLGRALAESGTLTESLAAFRRAESLLEAGERRYLVQLLETWSAVLEESGELSEALNLARRASRIAAERAAPPMNEHTTSTNLTR